MSIQRVGGEMGIVRTIDTLHVAELQGFAFLFAVGTGLLPDVVETAGECRDDIVAACQLQVLYLVLVVVATVLGLAACRVDFFAGELEDICEGGDGDAVVAIELLESNIDNTRLVCGQLGGRNNEVILQYVLFLWRGNHGDILENGVWKCVLNIVLHNDVFLENVLDS
jgi:hypothetical protein